VTVSLQRTGLPTFFAHVFGRRTAAVSASATAEAYNPANTPVGTSFTPIAPRAVKPWLVANLDPRQAGVPFISGGTVISGAITDLPFYLTANCGVGSKCSPGATWSNNASPYQVGYIPALVNPNTNDVCPTCVGPKDYERAIECSDVTPNAYMCGSTSTQWDSNVVPQGAGGQSADGAKCLIHATSNGAANSGQGRICSG
jgi:hypothetical protein